MQPVEEIIKKLRALPPERITEVEDFIDFLKQRYEDRHVTQAAMSAAQPSFNAIWDNPDDAEYDQL